MFMLMVVIWLGGGMAPLEVNISKMPITLDGKINPAEWADALVVDTWFETNPGDNVDPKVQNIGYLTYDQRYFYVGLILRDPDPSRIVAPIADRDQVPSYTDYAGILLDTANEGRVAQMFLANPRGVQYDALSADASGEDSSPDFFWEVATSIDEHGWNAEIRIPFSSLRYRGDGPQTWRFMLYRNYPRDYRYQMFSSQLPRDSSCFICNSSPVTGLENLPQGSHWVIAPYVFGSQSQRLGDSGSLETQSADGEPGVDLKWTPNPSLALDFTGNPDFSQIESDAAQITVNERFALFFAEKRPFFLEGADLFSTPFRAVHTRSITDPQFGARATGKLGNTAYTILGALDEGGGSVIIPGSQGSEFADQDESSQVWISRIRHDLGKGFASFLASDRESDDGSFNRVLGPDFDWRPNSTDQISGQVLFSQSQTPVSTDIHESWDGRRMTDWAGQLSYAHQTPTWDYWAINEYVGENFRADNGFIPQVGFNKTYAEVGHTWRYKQRFLHRLRTFFFSEYTTDSDQQLLYRLFSYGAGMSGKKNSFFRFRYARDTVRFEETPYDRDRFYFTAQLDPNRRFAYFRLDGYIGEEIDFANGRLGDALSFDVNATFLVSDHLEFRLTGAQRRLDISDGDAKGRLFTASIGRLRANYNFTARTFLRLIGQYADTKRDPALYDDEVDRKSGSWTSSLLLAYKVNWQSVIFVGYGDSQLLEDNQTWETQDRNWFMKVSYAYQH